MIRAWLTLALLLWAAPAHAAIALVVGQSAVASGNDATVTLPGATTSGNVVVIGTCVTIESQTISITGTTMTFAATSNSPVDHSGATAVRCYIFWAVADGDNTFTVTTSGASTALSTAFEFSGLATTTPVDQVGSGEQTAVNGTHQLSSGLATTVANEVIVAVIITGTTTTLTDGDGAGTDWLSPGGAILNTGMSQYRIVAATGTYQTPFTTNSAEDSVVLAASFKEATASTCSGGFMLRGAGGC